MCLLGLEEVQKYWRINNNVLDLFMQYLDESIAKRLHGNRVESCHHTEPEPAGTSYEENNRSMNDRVNLEPDETSTEMFEDQYFKLLSGYCEGDASMSDLGFFLNPQLQSDFVQGESLSFLER